MKKIMLSLIVVIMAVSVFAAKKNVILMIGDGMGINSVNMAEHYMGKDFPFTNWKTQLFATTYSANCPDGYDPAKAWTDPVKAIPNFKWLSQCTDSAAAATALNSGLKTNGGIVNYGPKQDTIYIPIGQYMKTLGYAVGSISTVTWYDATPSGPHGHSPNRGDINVATDMIMHPIDVLGGSGNPYYNGNGIKRQNDPSYSNFITKNLWDVVANGELGYKLLADSQSIKDLAKEKNPKGPYFLSLPNTGDLPYMKCGEISKNQYKDCPDDIITLKEMALSALNVLKENDKGFYLMIEGGAIDHGNHGNNWEHATCQMVSFAEAIEGVCNWVEKNSNWDETLLIVTADHQTGGLINEDGTYWLKSNGVGNKPKVLYNTGGHTNLPVPVFVKGSFADNIWNRVKGTDPVLGKYIDNTDIPQFFAEFVGFDFPIKPTKAPKINDSLLKQLDRYEQYLAGAKRLYKSATAKGSKDLKVDLNDNWAFALDKLDKGVEEKWYANPAKYIDVFKLSATKGWETQNIEELDGYDGCGWYYKDVKLSPEMLAMNNIYLYCGGADEQAWVYINGEYVGERTAKSTGKTPSQFWDHPLYIDITKYVKEDNDIIIRVYDDAAQGGLFGGVYIFGTYDKY